jgi:hypothetical protein
MSLPASSRVIRDRLSGKGFHHLEECPEWVNSGSNMVYWSFTVKKKLKNYLGEGSDGGHGAENPMKISAFSSLKFSPGLK